MEHYRKLINCVVSSSVKKFYIQLDKTTYVAINKNGDNINLYICQDQTCIKLNRDLILTLLSLKTIIGEAICHMSQTTQERETAV